MASECATFRLIVGQRHGKVNIFQWKLICFWNKDSKVFYRHNEQHLVYHCVAFACCISFILALNWRILLGVSFYKKKLLFFCTYSYLSHPHIIFFCTAEDMQSLAVILQFCCLSSAVIHYNSKGRPAIWRSLSLVLSTQKAMKCLAKIWHYCNVPLFGGETCLFARCFALNFCAYPRSRSLHHFWLLDDSKLGVNLWEQ